MCQIVEGHNISVPSKKWGRGIEALFTKFSKRYGRQGTSLLGSSSSATPKVLQFFMIILLHHHWHHFISLWFDCYVLGIYLFDVLLHYFLSKQSKASSSHKAWSIWSWMTHKGCWLCKKEKCLLEIVASTPDAAVKYRRKTLDVCSVLYIF